MKASGDTALDDARYARAAMCAVYGLGIIGMLGVYGVIQERIMSEPYNNEMFTVSVFLVLCNRLVGIVYACGMVLYYGEDCANKAPLWKYIAVSFSNVCATWCQYEALRHVSFPVQMLGKSFKMMPVMVWSIVISGKTYKAVDWGIALGVTWGVTQFLLTGEISSKHAGKDSSAYGLLLLLCFLAFDGFTSTFQEKLFKEHKTSKYNQMLYTNCGSAAVSFSSLIVFNQAGTALAFCSNHPTFVGHAMGLSAAAVAGQFFILSQVKEFGALVFAATMNLRQVISILVSYIMYSHPISTMQLFGLMQVFGALFYKSYLGYVSGEKGEKHGHAQLPSKEGDVELQKPSPIGAKQ